jgi:hypothetical protein
MLARAGTVSIPHFNEWRFNKNVKNHRKYKSKKYTHEEQRIQVKLTHYRDQFFFGGLKQDDRGKYDKNKVEKINR